MDMPGSTRPAFPLAAEVALKYPNVTLEICGSRRPPSRRLAGPRGRCGPDGIRLRRTLPRSPRRAGRVQLAPISAADRDQLLSGTMTRLLEGRR